jgi:hypothetical protein
MSVYLDETEEDFQAMRDVHLQEALTPLQASSNELVRVCDQHSEVSPQLQELVEQCRMILQNATEE